MADQTPDLTSDVADFDLDKSTRQAWDGFASRLAEVVSVMDPGATMSIGAIATSDVPEPPLVTFTCGDGGEILAEAASNATLADDDQLSVDQLAAMEEIGWQPPSIDGPHPSDDFTLVGTQDEPLPLASGCVSALRDVYGVPHPAFLAPDQLADILTPTPVEQSPTRQPAFNADSLIAIVPQSRQHLYQLIDAELTQLLGHQPVRDDDGDFALRVGSTMVFIRVSPDAEEVIVFSAIVHDLDGRTRAMEALSDLNTDARYVRFILIRDRVFVSLSIFAHPFVPAHLNQALGVVSVISDSIDNELARKLRGRTTFDDDGAPEA